MVRNRRHFTDEFKREAVPLSRQPDTTVSRVAQDLDLDPSVLRRWMGQMRGGIWESALGKAAQERAAAGGRAVAQGVGQVQDRAGHIKTGV